MKNYVGKRFGKLTVIEDLGCYFKDNSKRKRHYLKCICDCGNEKICSLDSVKYGHTTSCGCIKRESTIKSNISRKKYNQYYVDAKNIVYVKLSNCDDEMLCDIEDWNKLKKYCWYKNRHGYAQAFNVDTSKHILFHSNVIQINDNFVCDHINGNRIDNRKCNLRQASYSQNAMNRKVKSTNKTGYTGIYESSGRFGVNITINKETIFLGYFDNIKDAIKARQDAEFKYFGEFRRAS